MREPGADTCAACGLALDPATGETTHPWCDPGPPMTAAELAAAGWPAELANPDEIPY